jgi:hypothetical protein
MDNQVREGDMDLCTKLLRNKYLKDKRFFGSNARGGHSFGKDYMWLNTFVRVGSNMWWAMIKPPDFGMRCGW